MMTLEAWGIIAEIIAAAAVVASLIYLGIQVQHSNVLSRAQTRQSMMELTQEQLLLQVNDPAIQIGVFNTGPREYEEKIKINMWLTMFMRQREYEWYTYNEGIIDEDMFNTYTGIIPFIFSTERNCRWLELRKQINEFDPAFIEFVDDLIARNPKSEYPNLIEKWD